jgi:hypothetical protein
MPPDMMTVVDGTTDADFISDLMLESSLQFFHSGDIIDFTESDTDLPDNEERTMDLVKFIDAPDLDVGVKLHKIKCEDASCTESPNKYNRYRVSERTDPFMGTSVADQTDGNGKPTTMLSQLMSPIDYDSDAEGHSRQKIKETKIFSAWNTPKREEEQDYMLVRSSGSWQRELFDETSQDVTYPETPSSTESEAAAGMVVFIFSLIFMYV